MHPAWWDATGRFLSLQAWGLELECEGQLVPERSGTLRGLLGEGLHPFWRDLLNKPVASKSDEINMSVKGQGSQAPVETFYLLLDTRNKSVVFRRSCKKHLLPNTCFAICH